MKVEADRRLNIADADISFRGEWLTIRCEGALRATRNLRLKSEAGYEFGAAIKTQFVWFFQLTTGF
jgi:hypothetical protein